VVLTRLSDAWLSWIDQRSLLTRRHGRKESECNARERDSIKHKIFSLLVTRALDGDLLVKPLAFSCSHSTLSTDPETLA
jgi:hypothetical protein